MNAKIGTERLFVVTGGPGSGKTALIEALASQGVGTMPEAGRGIIRDQQAVGGAALPWGDREAFAEAMLVWEMRSHAEALRRGATVVFDRGVPDVAGYLRLCGLPVPAHVEQAARIVRYAPRVFLAPFWPEIFTRDAERRQDMAEAEATCEVMTRVYTALGYELVPLPLGPVAERVRFVRDAIGLPQRRSAKKARSSACDSRSETPPQTSGL
ncbi:putative ATPase [Amaricoccus macauensis]|uniref:Putative ATPase n=1 Tax=Amaricoccus macauensis TaxID=57001 RepID=A0A840SXI8_9RHOB|nr:AAA family ATPase [Amaricoccus macauensis]MBB5223821.1 putative ATPase [Amaricoccus macauensis]